MTAWRSSGRLGRKAASDRSVSATSWALRRESSALTSTLGRTGTSRPARSTPARGTMSTETIQKTRRTRNEVADLRVRAETSTAAVAKTAR